MEPWVRVKLEKAKDDMLTALEENIEGLEPGAEGMTYGLTAIKLCKKFWVKTFNDLPQKMMHQGSSSQEKAFDPMSVPEEQFHILRNINVSLRAQLKEQNKIARKVFSTIVGSGTTGAQIAAGSAGDVSATAGPNRSLDTIHQQLLEETDKIREELFLLQHSAQGTEFDKKDFSLNDYFRLAEFKLNHAANQVLWNSSSGGGNSIEIDMRIQALQSEHQAKMHRVEKQLEAERITVRSLAKTSRQEVEEVQHQHQTYVKKINQEHTDEIERLVSSHEEELKTVNSDYELKITELQHSFTQKLLSQSKDGGDASKALDDLRRQIEKTAGGGGGGGNNGPNMAQLRAGFGSSGVFPSGGQASGSGEVMSGAMDVLYDREREQDIHSVWDGESKETLMAQLQGRRAELEMLLSSHSIQMKARTLEWETALREIIAKYEKELQAAHHQAQMDSTKIESLTKSLETKQGEVDSVKALLVTERQAWEESKQEMQRDSEDRFKKQKLATTEVQGQLLAAKEELKSLIENQQLEIQQYDERELELTETIRDLRALVDNRANERHHKEVQTEFVTILKKGLRVAPRTEGGVDHDPSEGSSMVPWDDFGSLDGRPLMEGEGGGEGEDDVLSLASSSASHRKKKRSTRKAGGVGKPFQSPKPQSTGVSPKPQSFNVTPTARALKVGARKVQSPGASLSSSQISGGGVLGGNSSLAGSKGKDQEGDSTFLTTKDTTENQQQEDPVLDTEVAAPPTTGGGGGEEDDLHREEHQLDNEEEEEEYEENEDPQENSSGKSSTTNRRKKLGKLMSNKYANVKSKLDTKPPSGAVAIKTPEVKKPTETEFITPAEKPSFSTRSGGKYSNIRSKFVKPSEQSFSQGGDAGEDSSLKLGERRPSAGERRRQKVKEMETDADGNPKKHLADLDIETFGEESKAGPQQHPHPMSDNKEPETEEEQQQQSLEFGPPEDFTDVIQAIKQAEDVPPSALDLLPKTVTEPKFYELLGQMALLAEYATSSAKEHTTLQLVKKLKPLMPIRAWQKLINQQVLPIHPLDVTAVLHYFQEYLIPANTAIHRSRPMEVRMYKQVSEQVRTLSGLARANNIPRSFSDVSWDDLDAWVQDGQNYIGSSYISPEASPTKSSEQGRRGNSPQRSQRDRSVCLPPLEVKALIVHSIELLMLCRELNAEIANAPAASMSGTNLPKPPAMMIVSQVQLPNIGNHAQQPPTATAPISSSRTPRSHQHLVDTAKLKRDTRVTHVQSHRAHQQKWKSQLEEGDSGAGAPASSPAPLSGWATTPDHPSADFNSPGPAPGELSERGTTTSAGRWNQERGNTEIQSMVVLNNSPRSTTKRKKSRGGVPTASQSARK